VSPASALNPIRSRRLEELPLVEIEIRHPRAVAEVRIQFTTSKVSMRTGSGSPPEKSRRGEGEGPAHERRNREARKLAGRAGERPCLTSKLTAKPMDPDGTHGRCSAKS
jgi:hypothetical protein